MAGLRAMTLCSRISLTPTPLPEVEGQDAEPFLEPSPFGRGQGEGLTALPPPSLQCLPCHFSQGRVPVRLPAKGRECAFL
jgi:hypothetical protein